MDHDDAILPSFLHGDDAAAKLLAPIVGANVQEVSAMETLTANLHLLMASFYQPTKEKHKIILEGKAFPSDHVCFSLSDVFSLTNGSMLFIPKSDIMDSTLMMQ